jgi:hypothetical protein
MHKLELTETGKGYLNRLRNCSDLITNASKDGALTENDVSTLLTLGEQCATLQAMVQGTEISSPEQISAFDQLFDQVASFCELIEKELAPFGKDGR